MTLINMSFLFNLLQPMLRILIVIFDIICVRFSSRKGLSKSSTSMFSSKLTLWNFIVWLPYAYAFRLQHKEKKITLICTSTVHSLASKSCIFDEIIPISSRLVKDLKYRINLLRKLSLIKAQMRQPTISRNLARGDALMIALNSSKKISSEGDFTNMTRLESAFSKLFLKIFVPLHLPPNEHAFHRSLLKFLE